jgi:DNA-binding CsgD family transcriptional regulator
LDPAILSLCVVGLTNAEAAEVLGISEGSAKHYWIHARTWLYQEITAAREK